MTDVGSANLPVPFGQQTIGPIESFHGYAQFCDKYHLELEKEVGPAITETASSIEGSFIQQWELNKNLSGKKSQTQLRHDADRLDYGDQELKRITGTVQEDAQVFELTRLFVDEIYYGNLNTYLKARWSRIAQIPRSIWHFSIAFPIGFFVVLAIARTFHGEPGMSLYLGGVIVFAIVFFVVLAWVWMRASHAIIDRRTRYEESISHSVHILDRNLQELTNRLTTRMRDAADKLESLDLRDTQSLAVAQKTIGYLLRLRERKRSHRDYYRAYVDGFVRKKARRLLAHKYWRIAIQIALWLLCVMFFGCALQTAILIFGAQGLAADAAGSMTFLLVACAAVVSSTATYAAYVFGNSKFTSNIDSLVTSCLEEAAWARDSELGNENSRLDVIILRALRGGITEAVNRAVLNPRHERAGPPTI